MIGDRIDRLAQRLARTETYQLVIAPALADLQHEAPRGVLSRARGYTGVWCALVGGLADEIWGDFERTCTIRRTRHAAAGAVVVAALQVLHFLWMWSFNPHENPSAFLLLIPALVVSAVPAAMMAAAVSLGRDRRPGSERAVVLGSIAAAVLMLVISDQGVTRTNQQFRQTVYTERGGTGIVPPGANERTLADLWQRDDRESRIGIHLRLAIPASMVAWPLLGLALARARTVVICGTGVLAYGFFLASPFLASSAFASRLPVWAAWIPVGLLLITATGVKAAYVKRAG